uniref:Uncharacterized protein n=1 Tax=Amphilophus citrinellus TaxID=61819 RepID=A0A3Q0RZ89_AMPCI
MKRLHFGVFTKLFIKLSCLKYDLGSLVTYEKHEVANSTRAESHALFILVFVMRNFHHTIFGLHHQLLSLLSHQVAWMHERGPQVARPVSAGECGDILGQGGHAEGLVKDTAALVPITEWVPARAAEQGEGNMSLSHDDDDDPDISLKPQRSAAVCR